MQYEYNIQLFKSSLQLIQDQHYVKAKKTS